MNYYDCIILGAGVTGLTAAYKLSKRGKKVLVLERDRQAGGMLRTHKINNYFIEEYYHHVFKRDKEFIKLLKELGIYEKFSFFKASTSFLYKNQFIELSKPLDILFFKPFSFIDKLKFMLLMLRIKFEANPKKYDNVSVKEWIISNSSNAVFEKMFRPLLRSKFGDDMDNISAAWFIDRIKARSSRGSGGEILGYLQGSFKTFTDALKDAAESNGCEIRFSVKPRKLLIENNKITGIEVDNEKIKTDYVISTIPPKQLIRLGNFPVDFTEKLNNLDYQGCVCILLGLNKKLTDYYWTNIIDENILFGSIIEHTNFQPLSSYREHLVYLASYPDFKTKIWDMDDNQIFEAYISDLKRLVRIDEKNIKWYKVFKTKEAGLVYKKGISSNILDVRTPIEGLFVGGMFNSYPDRNINESVKIGMKCADYLTVKE